MEVIALPLTKSGMVPVLAWSPDGGRLAIRSAVNAIRIRDGRPGPPVVELRGHAGRDALVAWSADGTRVVSRDAAGGVLEWDARTGTPAPV
jgi:WD40 repeat protein